MVTLGSIRHRRRTVLPVGVLAITLALTLVGCGSAHSASGSDIPILPVAYGGLITPRTKVPKLPDALLGGGTLSLSSLKGKVVVLNFYASWCSPCQEETPLLVADAKAGAAKGLEVVGVLFKDSDANGIKFRHSYDVPYPSLVDRNGGDLARFRDVNPSAVPVTFVIDRSGHLAARYIGGISAGSSFNQTLAALEAEPA